MGAQDCLRLMTAGDPELGTLGTGVGQPWWLFEIAELLQEMLVVAHYHD